MDNKKYVIFISNSENEIEKLKKKLVKTINKKFEIEEYMNHSILNIYSDYSNYIISLILGCIFSIIYKFDVELVNSRGEKRKIDIFHIISISEKDREEQFGNVMENGRELVEFISEWLDIPVDINFNKETKCFDLSLNLADTFNEVLDVENLKYNNKLNYEDIVAKYMLLEEDLENVLESYILYKKDKVIFDIKLFDFSGNIKKEYNCIFETELEEALEYFKHTGFYKAISNPDSNNILLDKFSEKSVKTGETIKTEFGISRFDYYAKDVRENEFDFVVDFSTYFKEIYNLHCKKSSRLISFEMTDRYHMLVNIKKESSSKIVIVSDISMIRKTNQSPVNKNTVYDYILKDVKHENCHLNMKVFDVFQIADLNKLLHYSSMSILHEVYKIPIGFKFEDGLKSLKTKPIIYNSSNDNIND